MAFVNPEQIIKSFEIEPGMAAADFGAGSGHYVFLLARLVRDSGVVYAVDVQKELLDKIRNRAKEEGAENIETVWADLEKPDGSRLAENSLDFIIMSNLLFQLEDKEAAVKEAFRVLKSGGKAAVIDWSESFGGLGPRNEDLLDRRECEKMFLESGFILDKEFAAGDNHYGFLFRKP